MLELLLGPDWVANRNEMLARISGDVRRRRGGRILLVPELISHDTERRLCAGAGDSASRYAEVLSFTRLARRVAERTGAVPECLDQGGRVAAMAASALQLRSRLKAYASVETRPEFLTALVDAVDEFKRCCITSADLLAASRSTEGNLAQKLEELALLLDAYDGLCQRGKRDPRDQMTWLLEQLEECGFAQDHVFYIDGFPDFTRQHMAILEHLIRYSAHVTVSLTCTKPGDTAAAFEKAGQTAAQILRCAQRAGVEIQITELPQDNIPLTRAWGALFQGKTEHYKELDGRLLTYRAGTVYEECSAVAQRVLELVRQGCRYRDISVVCADMDGYRDMLSLVFHRCGIPLYLSGKEDILRKSVVATVLAALNAALGGFTRKDVMRYLRTLLSPLDVDACDSLENYAVLWNIQGSKWQSDWTLHPDGLGKDWTPGASSRLKELNEARRTALTPLVELSRGFRQAQNVSGQIGALYAFLERIGLAQRLSEFADRLDAQGDNRGAQILNQLWEILLSAMEQLHDILGSTVWEPEAFIRLLSLLLSQYDVGTIPPVLDGVTAGPVSAMRCQEEKHLIVVGALEGNLPKYSGSRGVLTDQERVRLRELGVPLTGGNLEGLQAEFAEIYGVFCGGRESIAVFCPDGQPSYVFRRLSELVGGEQPFAYDRTVLLTEATDAAGYLAALGAEDCAKSLGLERQYRQICRNRDYALGTVSQEHIRELYGKRLRLSASRIDRQASCRLEHFLRYGLNVAQRKEATVDPAEFGTYVHAVLERTVNAVMEQGGFHSVTLENTLTLALRFSDAYIRENFAQIDSGRTEYLLRRNAAELEMIVRELWQELSASQFQPSACELGFGEGKAMGAIAIEATAMQAELIGFVDRVDCWCKDGKSYFRVVDYKTGKKDFDYCDIFNGIGLQMLLYLFSLEQGGEALLGKEPRIAGVQYFSARVPVLNDTGRMTEEEAEKKRGEQWKRKGLLLSDASVLNAMEPEGSPRRLRCKRGENGEFSGDDLADENRFHLLKRYLFHLLGRLVDEIASGEVSPNPYMRGTQYSPCKYCPYRAICRRETLPQVRNYSAMSAERFWMEIEKEEAHG